MSPYCLSCLGEGRVTGAPYIVETTAGRFPCCEDHAAVKARRAILQGSQFRLMLPEAETRRATACLQDIAAFAKGEKG